MVNAPFIVFEGIDGTGKGTQAKKLAAYLAERVNVHLTREPGGTYVAEELRHLLLRPDLGEVIHPDVELCLMFSARAQHINEVITPKRRQNTWVICERFTDSSYAYQVLGSSGSEELYQTLNTHFVEDVCAPDLVFCLTFEDRDVASGRVDARAERDRIESMLDDGFTQRVDDHLRQKCIDMPQRYRLIDASGDIDTVFNRILEVMNELFPTLCDSQ